MQPLLTKNDRLAYWLIGILSAVVFTAVVILGRTKFEIEVGFDIHIFAQINAIINSMVSMVLLAALLAVRMKNYKAHRNLMFGAIFLSVFFLISYIAHHLLSGETHYPVNAPNRTFYFIVLFSHIVLAGTVLPFILLTAYRGATSEFGKHKLLARYTWPVWFYVSVTGVIVYLMISPYYQ